MTVSTQTFRARVSRLRTSKSQAKGLNKSCRIPPIFLCHSRINCLPIVFCAIVVTWGGVLYGRLNPTNGPPAPPGKKDPRPPPVNTASQPPTPLNSSPGKLDAFNVLFANQARLYLFRHHYRSCRWRAVRLSSVLSSTRLK